MWRALRLIGIIELAGAALLLVMGLMGKMSEAAAAYATDIVIAGLVGGVLTLGFAELVRHVQEIRDVVVAQAVTRGVGSTQLVAAGAVHAQRPLFRVFGVRPNGKEVTVELEADSSDDAVKEAKARGIATTRVQIIRSGG